jgi:glutamate formiminotransferase/formiminotetrahydrofolate cyclodeaminase
MTQRIVECIPNFSEARRPQVIEAIMQVISAVPGVSLLDRHSDLDHNRTVLTFVGPPEAVGDAAFRAVAKAAELIDLNQHTGEHPRIGATDVLPFVPISGVSMQECIEMARRLGRRVGEELSIPVYLYEDAATRPERQNLENIRRGQYEALIEEIATNPARTPDFGPSKLSPAGAIVIGARQPLIAYNVYLTTDDVSIAKKIARDVRHSSGGLRYVKGLGLLVDGRAQVSMNLTNFRGTPIPRVVELIRREAARYGVGVHHSELVGLIPQEALVDAAVWYLQLDQFESDQILEQRMAAVLVKPDGTDSSEPVEDTANLGSLAGGFLEALSASTPTPGGGSASAYSAAAGAALVAMVARLTIGRKKYTAVEEQMKAVLEKAESLRLDLTTAIDRDAAAFEAVMEANKLPKNTSEQQEARSQEVERATLGAAQVPLEVADMAVEVMELAVLAVSLGNLNAISDGATGAALARAGLTGAGYNVRINITGLQDQGAAHDLLEKLRKLEGRATSLEERIRVELVRRGGMAEG